MKDEILYECIFKLDPQAEIPPPCWLIDGAKAICFGEIADSISKTNYKVGEKELKDWEMLSAAFDRLEERLDER